MSSHPNSTRFGDTQTFNIAFDDDFSFRPQMSTSVCTFAGTDRLCTIDQVVHINPATTPATRPPEPADVDTELDTEARQRSTTTQGPNPLDTIPRASLFLAVAVLLFALVATLATTRRSTAPAEPDPIPASVACSTRKNASLPLLADLADLVVIFSNAPLPLFVNGQHVVDQHYTDHEVPRPNTNTSLKQTPITVFFTHLMEALNDVCEAATIWATSSKSPLLRDIRLLCQTATSSIISLPELYAETFSSAHRWSWSSVAATGRFVYDLRKYESLASKDALRLKEDCFYNTTSYNILRKLDLSFFTNNASPSDLVKFSRDAYDVVQWIGDLERGIATLHGQLSILSGLLRDHFVPDSRAHPRNKAQPRSLWFPRPPRHNHLDKTADDALAEIASRFDRLLPHIATTTTLTWIASYASKQVLQVVDRVEQLGNLTQSLLAVQPLSSGCQLPPSGISFPGRAWHPESWVVETYDNSTANGTSCVAWYLPPIQDITTTFEDLRRRAYKEAEQYEADYSWLCSEEQEWHKIWEQDWSEWRERQKLRED